MTRVLYLILLCFGTLFGLGAFFLLAGLLRLPTSASTKAVLTVTSRGKSQKGSINAVLFDMAARLSPLVHLDGYKRKKLEAQLKSAEIKMSPETYIAAAWVKAGLIALLIIPALLIFPILAPVIVFLAVAVYFKEQKRADEIVQQRREEIEAELPRFVNTIEQELRASRDVLNILKSYQRNAGHAMKRELEITIADMASGNEENALTRMESRIGSTMLSDVVRGLISVKRGDNGIMYFQMLSMTFKQLELQKLKLEAMKQPGKMRKYSFMLLGCFLLMYLGVLGYNQLDERWADLPYGTDNIGGYGCGPTSMAIVVSSLTDQTVDPPTMAEWAYQNGYWCSGNGSYHSLIPGAAEGFGLQWESISTDDPQAVVDALASGKLIVALMSKGHFTSSGHFSPTVVAAAITSRKAKNSLPTHILLENVPGLAPTSLLLLEQLRTIDRKRLRGYIGRISKEKMLEVDAALAISIGIGYLNERRTHNV